MKFFFKACYIVGISFLSLVLSFLFSELIFKTLNLSGISIVGIHKDYGWTLRPNVDLNYEAKDQNIHVKTNSLGFRSEESDDELKDSILLLGDSYLAGLQVDEKELFSNKLKSSGLKIINRGVPAWSNDQHLIYLLKNTDLSNIKKTVLLFSPNDIRENYAKGFVKFNNDQLKVQDYIEMADDERIRWQLSGLSYTYNYLASKKGWYEGSFNSIMLRHYTEGASIISDEELYLKQISDSVGKAYIKTEKIIAQIHKITKEKLVIVLIPTIYPIVYSKHNGTKVEDWLSALCEKEGIPFYSMQDLITADNMESFVYSVHYTPFGHTKVAERLESIIYNTADKDSQPNHQSPDSL